MLFTIAFAFYFKWQNKDKQYGTSYYPEASRKWHASGAIMRFLFFVTPAFSCFFKPHIKDIALAIAICLPLYDIALNIIALNKPSFYSGSTSTYDKTLGNIKWLLYLILLVSVIVGYIFLPSI
jgi:hypothetical protein